MSKFKVGDKVRVVKANNPNKQKFVGKTYEIENRDTGAYLEYLLRLENQREAYWFAEDELEPVSKRGRPRKGEERHKTRSCREEVDLLKKAIKTLANDFKEFKQTTQTNITRLGYEFNRTAVSKPEEKKIELTDAERVILENLDKKFKWIARDRNEDICIYLSKPSRNDNVWIWNEGCKDLPCSHLFQFIRWEDNEPYEIAKLLEG